VHALTVFTAIIANEQPSSSAPAMPSVKISADGYPILPVLGDDGITPKLARDLLRDFISAAWGVSQYFLLFYPINASLSLDLAVRSSSDSEPIAIPWDAMSLAQRSVYMAADILPSFPDLNPMKMSRESTYLLFEALLASQLKQEHLLEFSITKEALHKLRSANESPEQHVDDDIIELDDPPRSPFKSRKTSPVKTPGQPVDFSPPSGETTSGANQSAIVAPTSSPTPHCFHQCLSNLHRYYHTACYGTHCNRLSICPHPSSYQCRIDPSYNL